MTSRTTPRITCVVVFLNAGRFLNETIASVLAQTLDDWELLLVDDGYADNWRTAKPLLERSGLPATVFVTAGFVGTPTEFWTGALTRVLLGQRHLPAKLRLEIQGRAHEWDVAGDAGLPDRSWRLWDSVATSPRRTLLQALDRTLRPLPTRDRDDALAQFLVWAGDDAQNRGPTWLSEAELRDLADGALIDIGAHSMSHALLASQSEAAQRWEIASSRMRLEEMIHRRVRAFAYPYGQRSSYTEATVRLVGESGFDGACAGWPGPVRDRKSTRLNSSH